MWRLLSLLLLFLIVRVTSGQTLSADFTAATTVCLSENIILDNSSSNASNYIWDFCQEDLKQIVSTSALDILPGASIPEGIKTVYDKGNYYTFVTSRENNKIFRINLGVSVDPSTDITDLNVTGLSLPTDIRFVQENGVWYGLVINLNTGTITRFRFGNGVDNPPDQTTDLGSFGALQSGIRGFDLVFDGTNWIGITVNNHTNDINLVNLGASIASVGATSSILVTQGLATGLTGVSVVKDASGWFAYVAGNSSGNIVKVNFGNNLMTVPSASNITSIYALANPAEIQVQKEGINFYGHAITNNGELHFLNLGTNLSTPPIETLNKGNLNGALANGIAFEIIRTTPNWKGLAVDYVANQITRVSFSSNCSTVSLQSSTQQEPAGLSFSGAGQFPIELTAYDVNRNASSETKTITVNNLQAPIIDFTTDNACLAVVNIFTPSITDPSVISNWSWDFGDSNVSSGSSGTHTYSSVGNYQVNLIVTGQNGCLNSKTKNVPIYNPPISNFSLPPGTICTGQAQVFTNTSSYDNGSNPAWTWSVDGIPTSTSTNLSQFFATTGSHDVKLTTTILGCSNEKTTTVSLQSGPMVDFTYTHNCFGQPIQFTNTTTGTGITTYSWDFDDGNTDALQWDTQHLFAQGDYAVTLTVNNTIGCSNKKIVPISVRNQPLADFNYSNAIENVSTNFQGLDLTLSDDAVNRWTWAINGSSPMNGQSINFTFASPGSYSGSLSVQTNQGCSYIATKTISISASTAPTILTALSPSACLTENLNFQNTSVNSSSFLWDFCFEDLKHITDIAPLATVPSAMVPEGIKTVYELGVYYTFLTSRDNNKLFRISLGTDVSLASPADILDLNVSGLAGPTDLRFVKENNTWYALIINILNGHLVRLRFGNGLANSPDQVSDLGTVGILEPGTRGFDLAFDGSNWLASMVNFANNKIYSINLGPSISSIGTATSNSFTSSLVVAPTSVALTRDSNGWKAMVTSYSTNQIVRIDYGLDILATPGSANVVNVYTVLSPLEIALVKEGLTYYAYVITQGGELHYLNFGSNVSSSLVESANHGSLGVLANGIALDIVRTAPYWKGLVVDFVNLKITKVYFSSSCSYVSAQQSTLKNPSDFNFTAAGSYAVELTAYHQNGNLVSQQSVVNVSGQMAPSLNFAIDNSRCINVANTFTSQASENLVHTTWSFGDGSNDDGTHTVTNHTFTSTGQKTVSLEAKGISGCSNFKSQTISIFNPPNASFTLPVASPYCSNQLYTYTNTSTFDSGSSPSWQWNVNGQNIATTQDLNYLFTSASSQSVSLTASIPGCSSQATQSVTTLVPGPLIRFNAPVTGCTDASITFTNVTTDPVIGFSWTFGDGNSSAAFSSSNTYAAAGQYQVLLSASNAAGCQNSFSQSINIYSNPQPDFAIEAPPLQCEKWPAQFDNLTPPLPDSNIASWQWSFGDASNGSAVIKNPSHIYAIAGSYNVTLQAKSNFGCTNSIQKTVTVFPSPQASFVNDPACVNQSTQFKNKSTGNIATYQWGMDGNTFAVPDPIYTFKSPGNYPVTLTVTSSNGCISQYPSTVIVPAVPNLDFSVQAPCTGHSTIFQELSAGSSDQTTSWNWSFGQGSGVDSPVRFLFSSPGTYPVTMITKRESGCVYSFSKDVTIYDGPIASFTPSVVAGAAPLAVTFVNNSPAESSSWNFGDQSPPVDATSPLHTFNSLGAYKVILTAKSHSTCSDTTSVVINVVIPHIDIVMNSFSLTDDPSSNSSKPLVSILNSGNIPLVNPEVVFDLGGGVLLKEKIAGTVKPGKSIVQTLDVQIVPQSIQYVCAEIDVADDVNSTNNKQCISLSNEDVVMNPYPNPTTSGQLNLQWIGATQENVRVTVYTSDGQIAFQQNLDDRQSGLSQLTIDTSSFANGLYLIQFVGGKITKTFRIVIAN